MSFADIGEAVLETFWKDPIVHNCLRRPISYIDRLELAVVELSRDRMARIEAECKRLREMKPIVQITMEGNCFHPGSLVKMMDEAKVAIQSAASIPRSLVLIEGRECGDHCNRNHCSGIIQMTRVENCSCHIRGPCPGCEASRPHCPICGWGVE